MMTKSEAETLISAFLREPVIQACEKLKDLGFSRDDTYEIIEWTLGSLQKQAEDYIYDELFKEVEA
jgi:hypothetical protein